MHVLQFNIKYFFIAFCPLFAVLEQSFAQDLKVVSRHAGYRDSVRKDSLRKMVEVRSFLPSAAYDLRYATKNNFTGQKLYKKGDKTFLRLPAADALRNAANELAKAGYTLKIWDAYRPYTVTKKMWELIHDVNEKLFELGCNEWITSVQIQIRSGGSITGDEKTAKFQ